MLKIISMHNQESEWHLKSLPYIYAVLYNLQCYAREFMNVLNSGYHTNFIDEQTGASMASVTHDPRASKG